jgi:hypothetical protein
MRVSLSSMKEPMVAVKTVLPERLRLPGKRLPTVTPCVKAKKTLLTLFSAVERSLATATAAK